jgi:propionyl-CoA carboxylase alpha chain
LRKILIANRGEIAVRVIRTLQKMGIKSVAVYSEADFDAMHVKMADEAYLIGPAPSSESYLNQDKIVELAKLTGSEGIHPGYGFLSENPEFPRRLEKEGIILIGPSAHSMEIMGSKLAAKNAVKAFDIPMVPGTDTALKDINEARQVAEEVGFPLLIKASAGGGGKGMRIVEDQDHIEEQLNMAMSEALSSFGDSSVFIEKYVEKPRHIEFQILADNHGNVIHLFERECSIQRRHQKVVEEAPSIVLSEVLRDKMGQAAINVARACNYSGAGTVEFLLDADLNFYFLEMNTRLQVEHPVTEMITGVDLVEQQIRVARGEKLQLDQTEICINGHSIELRVYAEDPFNNFLPSINRLSQYQIPVGEGIRVDHGFEQGMDIPIYYDPMIAKLVTYGETREAAIEKMKKAISDYIIEGIETTLDFGTFVMNNEAFVSGDFDTHFIKNHFSNSIFSESVQEIAEVAAAFMKQIRKEENERLKL